MHDAIERQIAEWEGDISLLEADRFRHRLEILDHLDAHFSVANPKLQFRIETLCAALEAANAGFYRSIRTEIQQSICPAAFLSLLPHTNSEPLPNGIGYDYLDELLSGILQLNEPDGEPSHTGPEKVFYQPTPARHIFALNHAAAISANDVLVDLGSGLGHVPLIASACTGAHTIGVELEPSFIASARQCAQQLNLSNVSFLEQDARNTDFSTGTIFYLYTPFTGSILRTVLDSLRREAATRPFQVCTFGPCTRTIAQQSWLEAAMTPEDDRITIFRPRS